MRYFFATLVCAGIILLTMFLNYAGVIPGFTEIAGAIGSAIGAAPSVKAFLMVVLIFLYFGAAVRIWRSIAYKEKKSIDADTTETKSSGSQKKGFWFGVLTAGIIFLVLAFSGEFLEILRSNKTPGFSQEKTVPSPELPRSSAKRTTSGNSYNKEPVYRDQTYLYATDNSNTKKKTAPNTSPQEGQKWIADLGSSVKMEFMPINAGSFMMGSNNGASNEKPAHKVTLTKPFWMAKTEVTQAEFGMFIQATSYETEAEKTGGVYQQTSNGWEKVNGEKWDNVFAGSDRPVTCVSWVDATEFCKWLTQKERQAGRLPVSFEYTLPTEAQWEYACRAGTTGDYAGDLDSMAWYKSNAGDKTHPVRQKQPNAWGLYDMHGNVSEWCLDADSGGWIYENGPSVDPVDTGVDPLFPDDEFVKSRGRYYRIYRDGAFRNSARNCRSACRSHDVLHSTSHTLGFRPIVMQR